MLSATTLRRVCSGRRYSGRVAAPHGRSPGLTSHHRRGQIGLISRASWELRVFCIGCWGCAVSLWALSRAMVEGEPSRGDGQGIGQRLNRCDIRHSRPRLRSSHGRISQTSQPGQRSHGQPLLLACSTQAHPDTIRAHPLTAWAVAVESIGKERWRESERRSDFFNRIEPRDVARLSLNVEDRCSCS